MVVVDLVKFEQSGLCPSLVSALVSSLRLLPLFRVDQPYISQEVSQIDDWWDKKPLYIIIYTATTTSKNPSS